MLRGRLISTVRPVTWSTLATVMLSGRRPVRSAPASPPISRMLMRPSLAVLPPPPAKTLLTSWRWAETTLAEATSPTATAKARPRLSSAKPSRCRRARSGGLLIRQASRKSRAQATPSPTSSHLEQDERDGLGEHGDGGGVPDEHEEADEQRERPQRRPDPQGDAPDAAVARGHLGGARQDQRHRQEGEPATELDPLAAPLRGLQRVGDADVALGAVLAGARAARSGVRVLDTRWDLSAVRTCGPAGADRSSVWAAGGARSVVPRRGTGGLGATHAAARGLTSRPGRR